MKSKWTVIAVVLAVVFGNAFLYFKGRRYEVVITQDQIDRSFFRQLQGVAAVFCFNDLGNAEMAQDGAHQNPHVGDIVDDHDRQVGQR